MCVGLFSLSPLDDSGSWSEFTCYEMKFQTMDDEKFLVVNDGFETSWYKAEDLSDEGLYLKGSSSASASHHSGCSVEMYISNLELSYEVPEEVDEAPEELDDLGKLEDLSGKPIEAFAESLWDWFVRFVNAVLGTFSTGGN